MVRKWTFGNTTWAFEKTPRLMGILNVTPDSFSDGGQYLDPALAIEQGLRLVEEGADILDLGGESTRPKAEPVSEAEELRRVVPVIKGLRKQSSIPISIDTTKSNVARQAVDLGADIINDISGLTFDHEMLDVCRANSAGIICNHIQGTPQTMQENPCYEDAVSDIVYWLNNRLSALQFAEIELERIVIDPGIGFGKTMEHNLELLSHVDCFHELERPVLIGHSRKRFLKQIVNRVGRDDHLDYATVGVSIALATQGTEILRVHNVAATKNALTAWCTVTDAVGDVVDDSGAIDDTVE